MTRRQGPKRPVVEFSRDRTIEMCRVVTRAWENKQGYLANCLPPEEMFHPEGIEPGTREHSLYLFFVAWLSRSGKSANQVMRVARRITHAQPWLIDPLRIDTDKREIEVLQEAIPFATDQYDRVGWWLETLELVRTQYDGDVRNLMLSQTTALKSGNVWQARDGLIDRLCDMKGIGHKIAQLTIMWYQSVDWKFALPSHWQLFGKDPVVAVDIWMLRLLEQTSCLHRFKSDHRDRIGRPVADYLSRVLYEQDLDHIAYAQGAWHIMARIHRSWQLKQNDAARARHCYSGCPVHDICRGNVAAHAELKGRGKVGWGADNLQVRPTSHGLFPAEEIQLLSVPNGHKAQRLREPSIGSVSHQLGLDFEP